MPTGTIKCKAKGRVSVIRDSIPAFRGNAELWRAFKRGDVIDILESSFHLISSCAERVETVTGQQSAEARLADIQRRTGARQSTEDAEPDVETEEDEEESEDSPSEALGENN